MRNQWKRLLFSLPGMLRPIWITLVILIFFWGGGLLNIYEFLARQASKNEIPNTLCSAPAIVSSKLHPPPPRCLNDATVQFDTAIFVVTDGWPRAFSRKLFEEFSAHSIGFSVDVPGLKLSHSIFSSYFSGQSDVSFWMRQEIRGDTLFDSMFRAGKKVRWLGKRLCLMDLLGPKREEQLVDVNFVHEGSFSNTIHPSLILRLHEIAEDVYAKNQTLYAYSAVYDTQMHKLGWDDPKVIKMLDTLQTKLFPLRQWIDEHPEVLLVFQSDHGVDGLGNLLHGNTMAGNDGVLMFYNPQLPHRPEKHIDVVDVAPTIAKYLRGVDIPANSVGRVHNHYGAHHDRVYPRVLIENAWQLARVAISGGKTPVIDVTTLSEEDDVEELEEALESLKSQVGRHAAASWSAFPSAVCLVYAIILLVRRHNTHILAEMRKGGRYRWMGLFRLVVMVTLYTGVAFSLWSLLFLHTGPSALVYNTRLFPQLFSPLLTMVLLWRARHVQQDSEEESEESVVVVGGSQTLVMGLGLNEVVNSVLLGLLQLFPKGVNSTVSFFPWWVQYGILCGWAWNICGRPRWRVSPIWIRKWKQGDVWPWTVMILAAMITVELTKPVKELYFLSGFHPAGAVVYLGASTMLIRAMWAGAVPLPNDTLVDNDVRTKAHTACHKAAHRAVHSTMPLVLLAFFVMVRWPLGRMTLLLFVWRMDKCLGPCVSATANPPNDPILSQGTVLLLLNQTFWTFGVSLSSSFDINVDPFSGRVGIINFDMHPFVSAFFMAYSKYWPFFIAALFLWHSRRDALGQAIGGAPEGEGTTLDMPQLTLLLQFSAMNITFFFITWRYWMGWRLSDVLISAVMGGCVGGLYTWMSVLRHVRARMGRFLQKRITV